MTRTALVMAGGTGGHIFPGLAVAEALRDRGWAVHWLGAPGGMEQQLVPPRGFAFEPVQFGGLRGKGPLTLLMLPARLLRAFVQSIGVLRRVRPDVVIGLGGYITFPGGLMSVLLGKPLVLHEQNSVAGLANKVLASVANRVFTAFPNVLKNAQWVGNPLREAFVSQPDPVTRFTGRSGPLKLLVVGGSLGAKALNSIVPKALARIAPAQRPIVMHQSGAKQIDDLRANYVAAGVEAELTPFIDDTATAYATADLIVARAGASTVTEIAAVGAAALFVPFPSAVDDHQTTNARFLVDAGGGWLVQQTELTPELLADLLQKLERTTLVDKAVKAKTMQKTEAVSAVVLACEELAAKKHGGGA
ncbi:undecaprenyldiphospho-muramoylpentapeptide beta-N-acetylglucosaminyltransferase [Variovorax arabinosiphilus]|uniref:undecaprenyldiphospho-muramoylpentapeptide beta-N-acetylglucosaminyltransferase n=1 Tax=Variovorax arabinosiphilus TaxID=3053498 RepID=UPI002575755C|nr:MULTISPECIES: undecaprenyldiphospho-muramoylpentapeptide beta-N-acetylglucosaminyltransferase [unclassified Variovorax]MDM0122450.1 undecaprenyldiphospho-muramoylpentapeptide beta-N-acetylglucosaminyltransferase [Variovorax sp. J2L1-78]MDM0131021.1 undecaprenyldiphospho-muramoylpentapeptide beta-N-acetylglucosaminyltransferase [Variovorax sp. J2L1-63]MDM0235213.1 undecaprenyldiphospho-muramoylpentapeptide beta-N-acetylglucosaminyltransferase [Variovorax sp. J2R1-6]